MPPTIYLDDLGVFYFVIFNFISIIPPEGKWQMFVKTGNRKNVMKDGDISSRAVFREDILAWLMLCP